MRLMTEHTDRLNEQISGFIDDELSREECEFFVRRLQRDSESRSQYIRYQVIGAAIRGEHVTRGLAGLRERVQHALEDRPGLGAEVAPRRHHPAWHWAAGASIAVSVAAVAVLGLRFAGQLPFSFGSGSAIADQRLELVEPPSYVVPRVAPQPQIVAPTVQLTGLQYLMHHGRHASTLGRTVVHSNVVAVNEDDVAPSDEEATQ